MWADNETDIDLLGFEFLVDGLIVALTEPRLLPLTVGVIGDWGSGKSSLMRIASSELPEWKPDPDDAPPGYITVSFSPWQYEDHEDVKMALMGAVLDALAVQVPGVEDQIGVVRAALDGLRRWGRRVARVGAASIPTALPIVMQAVAPDIGAEVVDVVTVASTAAVKEVESVLAPSPRLEAAPPTPTLDPRGDVDTLRREFQKLVLQLPNCAAVVVFIDDLDRCLPGAVVDTFEAIRLFLNTPKTAYVLALNQSVVESAIDSRYPELRKQDGAGIGRDYLEKMLQLKVAIPPLSEPEAETYVNLLFADLHLGGDQFQSVLAATTANRRENGLAVAFNLGIAGELLGNEVPPALSSDLGWAAEIAPVLGSSLRGNPRQLKRFLNNLLLKHRSARRRGVSLDLPILAKLMVLEDQYKSDFQQLFDWEIAAQGRCSEIGEAESRARGGAGSATVSDPKGVAPALGAATVPKNKEQAVDSVATPAQLWAEKGYIGDWLRVEPPFSGTDLRPYFTYSRDRLSFGVSGSRLSPDLQRLLIDLQVDSDVVRRRHVEQAAELPSPERTQFVEALLERVRRNPGATATTAAIELAGRVSETIPTVCGVLMSIPAMALPVTLGTLVVRVLPQDHPDVVRLLSAWENGDNKPLKTMVETARRAHEKGTRRGNLR